MQNWKTCARWEDITRHAQTPLHSGKILPHVLEHLCTMGTYLTYMLIHLCIMERYRNTCSNTCARWEDIGTCPANARAHQEKPAGSLPDTRLCSTRSQREGIATNVQTPGDSGNTSRHELKHSGKTLHHVLKHLHTMGRYRTTCLNTCAQWEDIGLQHACTVGKYCTTCLNTCAWWEDIAPCAQSPICAQWEDITAHA